MGGFNEAWRLWIILESFSNLTNGDFENRFADKGSRPDGVKKVLFCDQLARTPEEIVQHREGLGSELYLLCPFPKALIGQVQTKGIEVDAFCVRHCAPCSGNLTAGL